MSNLNILHVIKNAWWKSSNTTIGLFFLIFVFNKMQFWIYIKKKILQTRFVMSAHFWYIYWYWVYWYGTPLVYWCRVGPLWYIVMFRTGPLWHGARRVQRGGRRDLVLKLRPRNIKKQFFLTLPWLCGFFLILHCIKFTKRKEKFNSHKTI